MFTQRKGLSFKRIFLVMSIQRFTLIFINYIIHLCEYPIEIYPIDGRDVTTEMFYEVKGQVTRLFLSLNSQCKFCSDFVLYSRFLNVKQFSRGQLFISHSIDDLFFKTFASLASKTLASLANSISMFTYHYLRYMYTFQLSFFKR